MGSVYEAKHTGTGRRVAVKIITGDLLLKDALAVSRFQREAKAAGSIDTQHIAQVLDAGTDGATGAPYLVMEYLKGEDLQQLLKRVGPLPPEIALRIVAQACIGLGKAHEARVIHRDIKPANLFLALQEEGEILVKILDFGIAKIKPDEARGAETTGLTRTGGLLGSPFYMSPEQVRGSKEIDYRTDLWSLGIVLYHALSGRVPHGDVEGFGELIMALCSEAPRPVQRFAPWVPKEVAAVVHGALGIDPDHRYPSAAAMLDAIKPLLAGGFRLSAPELGGLSEAQRAVVAPKLETSDPSLATTQRWMAKAWWPLRSSDRKVADTNDGVTQLAKTRERKRPRSPVTLALGAALGLGLSAWGLNRAMTPAAPSTAAAETTADLPGPRQEDAPALARAAPTATPDADTRRRVQLVVRPSDASVEIEGAEAPVRDGIVEISGELGSVHRVRVWKGKDQQTGSVLISEAGAIPPEMEIGAKQGSSVGRGGPGTGKGIPRGAGPNPSPQKPTKRRNPTPAF
jgi:eukaryotic-like serine/threonine-protein kinase